MPIGVGVMDEAINPFSGFEISISGNKDGKIEAAYIKLKNGDVARTNNVIKNILLTDCDACGDVLGIEILGPVKISSVINIVDMPLRRPLRRFFSRAAPRDLVRSS